MPESTLDLGNPIPIKERPPSPPRGGRAPVRPAYEAWLQKLQPGAEFEMASNDEDKAHSISRLNTLRQIAKEMSAAEGATRVYQVDAVPVVPNKRYRIFGSVKEKAAAAPASKAEKAEKAAAAAS